MQKEDSLVNKFYEEEVNRYSQNFKRKEKREMVLTGITLTSLLTLFITALVELVQF